jgi:hypothetical protein
MFRKSNLEWQRKSLTILGWSDRRLRKLLMQGWIVDGQQPNLLAGTSVGTTVQLIRRNPKYQEPLQPVGRPQTS